MGLFNRKSTGKVDEDLAASKIAAGYKGHKTRKELANQKTSPSKEKKHPLNGTVFVTDADAELAPKVGKKGPAAMKPTTIVERLEGLRKNYGDRPALKAKRKGGDANGWVTWTYKQYADDVFQAAASLVHLGLKRFAGVNILGFNSPEWFIADVAGIVAGGISTGIYSTNKPDACKYICQDSAANVVFVEDDAQLQKILEVRKELPDLKAIVQWSGKVKTEDKMVYSWKEFMELGDDKDKEEVDKRVKDIRPGHCATLIYTSGTTGNPKGVMLSHDNITWTAKVVIDAAGLNAQEEQHIISYLPLSHIAAQLTDLHGPMTMAACVWFAQPDALKGSLPNTLREVRPTMFLGVPRVWEKIEEKMKEIGASTKGLKLKIAKWAKKKGALATHADMTHSSKPSMYGLANKLVFSKVRKNLGLDRCTFCLTGAAPIARETLEYFGSLHIPIYEIYGMSECTGPETISLPNKFLFGSCGAPMEGTELELMDQDKDGNGEICYRGRHIMMGYLNREEATAETIDKDGFLHSGDVGKLEGGFLKITGRIKELLVTAGGENVAPVPIEDTIKEEAPAIANIMVIGDHKKFLSALVTLKTVPDKEGQPSETLSPLALQIPGIQSKTVFEAAKDKAVQKYLEDAIARANNKAISNAARVQKFKLITQDFTVDGGELTPSMKLKRKVVAEMYKDLIDDIYA